MMCWRPLNSLFLKFSSEKHFYFIDIEQRKLFVFFLMPWDYRVQQQLLFVPCYDGNRFRAQVRGRAWGLICLFLSILPLLLRPLVPPCGWGLPAATLSSQPASDCMHGSPDSGPATLHQGEWDTVLPVLNLSLSGDSEITWLLTACCVYSLRWYFWLTGLWLGRSVW